jgi:hypothetical protein
MTSICRRKQRLKSRRSLQSFIPPRLGLLILGGALSFLLSPAAFAQLSSPTDVAQFVYQRMPTLAVENQYVRADNNKQAAESTLVSRLVQYHNAVKGRSPLYRIDWKITLADYLGINEVLEPETYPGRAFLKKNPIEGDLAVIQKLNSAQRNALVQSLVDASTGSQTASAPVRVSTPPAPQAKPSPKPTVYRPTLTPLAAPGSADFLKPNPIGRPSTPGGGEAQFLK